MAFFNNIKTFYRIWMQDVLSLPFHIAKKHSNIPQRIRKPVVTDKILIIIHEWGGYNGKRLKKIKGIAEFECGLDYQLERFEKQNTDYKKVLTITMSDPEKYGDLDNLRSKCDQLIFVTNQGMDFSGYSKFISKYSAHPNSYIILSNSSVNKIQTDFLDSYINYLEHNQDVGLLGVSCNSKYYHTLLRANYNPHLQSFFIMTTLSVLNEIIELNGGEFPGIQESNKHLLIRNGEVKLSKLALELGYKLAVVTQTGVYKFDYDTYPLKKGDFRIYTKMPNAIFPITN